VVVAVAVASHGSGEVAVVLAMSSISTTTEATAAVAAKTLGTSIAGISAWSGIESATSRGSVVSCSHRCIFGKSLEGILCRIRKDNRVLSGSSLSAALGFDFVLGCSCCLRRRKFEICLAGNCVRPLYVVEIGILTLCFCHSLYVR